MRFQQRRTSHFESKVKAIYGTLPCCDVLSVLHLNRIIFRQICALTPDILFPSPPTQRSSWLLRSVFAIRSHSSRLLSLLSSCFCFEPVRTDHWPVQIFLFTTHAPQSNLDYNLRQNRMEQQTPIPNQDQSKRKPHRSPKGPFFPSLGGGSGG